MPGILSLRQDLFGHSPVDIRQLLVIQTEQVQDRGVKVDRPLGLRFARAVNGLLGFVNHVPQELEPAGLGPPVGFMSGDIRPAAKQNESPQASAHPLGR